LVSYNRTPHAALACQAEYGLFYPNASAELVMFDVGEMKTN